MDVSSKKSSTGMRLSLDVRRATTTEFTDSRMVKSTERSNSSTRRSPDAVLDSVFQVIADPWVWRLKTNSTERMPRLKNVCISRGNPPPTPSFINLFRPCKCSWLCFNRQKMELMYTEKGQQLFLGQVYDPWDLCNYGVSILTTTTLSIYLAITQWPNITLVRYQGWRQQASFRHQCQLLPMRFLDGLYLRFLH